jgi:hypothetical protein
MFIKVINSQGIFETNEVTFIDGNIKFIASHDNDERIISITNVISITKNNP